MRPTCALLAFGLAWLLLPSPARADPETYELTYSAPATCPREAEVVREVRANVRDAANGDGAHIALSIVQEGTAFVGELVARDRSGKEGSRRIQGTKCSEVSQTLAFLAALAIELGGHVEAEPEAAKAPEPPRPPPAAPLKAAPPKPPARPVPRPTWRMAGLIGAGLRGGIAPSLRPSAELGLDVVNERLGALSPALRLTAVGSRSRISHSDGAAKLSLLAGRLEGCPLRFGSTAIGLRPCLGLELGAVWARGELDGGRKVIQRWSSAEAGLRLEVWPLSRFFMELNGAAVLPFFRTRYFFVPDRIVYVVPRVTARVGLAVGYRFQ